jgi:hypothetical protein
MIAGCGANLRSASSNTSVQHGTSILSGSVHGGQQPITGATIQLYAVGTGGYAAAATPLLTATVTTSTGGFFSISGDYSCTGVTQVYLTATGGDSGSGINNPALVLMAPLGSCATLLANASTTFIDINEVSTVAGAWTLGQFMSSPKNAGTTSGNATGVANAFAAANEIVNLATGSAPGLALPAGAMLPVAEINTLANILSTCVNSSGLVTSSTPCGQLFAAATPPGGSAPADTFTAALNIAHNAGNNVAALYALATPSGPFQPALASAPSNWLVGIRYTGGGLASPSAIAVDNSGNVWVANSPASPATSSVSEFSPIGAALSSSAGYTAGNISSPSAIAIDPTGNAWVANSTNDSITKIAPLGASASNFPVTGLNLPSSLSIDGVGNVWVTNKGNNSIIELSSSGSALSPTSGYLGGGLNQPVAIAVNTH